MKICGSTYLGAGRLTENKVGDWEIQTPPIEGLIVIKHHTKNLRNPSKIERVMDLSARARVISFGKMTINVRIYLDL